MELVIKNAEKSVTIMTTAQGLMRKVEGLKPVFEKLKKKGVKIKIAAPLGKVNSKTAKDFKAFAELKHIDKSRSRFIVVDGKELVFALLDDAEVHPTYDTGIWVKTPFFVNAVQEMFNSLWEVMKPADSVVKQ